MKFRIQVESSDGKKWWELYDKNIPDPEEWAKAVVQRFNDTLRPHELSRTLLNVVRRSSTGYSLAEGKKQ